MLHEADAQAGCPGVEVLDLLAVGHDGGGEVREEGHLREEVRALEGVDDLILRVEVAEVLGDAGELHPAADALEHLDDRTLETALGVARVRPAWLERAEPVGVLEVPLEHGQRFHQAGTLDEGERFLEERMQVHTVGADLAVGCEHPDGALAGVLQVVPVGHGVGALDPRSHQAQVDGVSLVVEALGPEETPLLVLQFQGGGFEHAQVERLAVRHLEPTGGVADVVGRVRVLREHHSGVVVRAQEAVEQPDTGAQDDVVRTGYRQTPLVAEVLLEVGQHHEVADTALLQLGYRVEAVSPAELVPPDGGGVEVGHVERHVRLARVPEVGQLERQLGVRGRDDSLEEGRVDGHVLLLVRGTEAGWVLPVARQRVYAVAANNTNPSAETE